MATTKSVTLTLGTVTDDGKKSSQTFKNVNPDATDENMSASLDILGGMQSNTVNEKHKNVKTIFA